MPGKPCPAKAVVIWCCDAADRCNAAVQSAAAAEAVTAESRVRFPVIDIDIDDDDVVKDVEEGLDPAGIRHSLFDTGEPFGFDAP